jgi:putative peptidoglycan lipid II flippase
MAVNAILNAALVRVLGFKGLALGTSIAALFNATVLLLFLRQRLNGLNGGRLFSSFLRIGAASAAMGVAAAAVSAFLLSRLPGTSLLVQLFG